MDGNGNGTERLLVTGIGRGDFARFEVGPEDEKNAGHVAFGMGAEVSARFGHHDFEYDVPMTWDVTLSQGGIGGQSIDTARIRAAAFSLAVEVAERFKNAVEHWDDLDKTSAIVDELTGAYPLPLVGRGAYPRDGVNGIGAAINAAERAADDTDRGNVTVTIDAGSFHGVVTVGTTDDGAPFVTYAPTIVR